MKNRTLIFSFSLLLIGTGLIAFYAGRNSVSTEAFPGFKGDPRYVTLVPVIPEDSDEGVRWGKLGVYLELRDTHIIDEVKAAEKRDVILLAGYRDGVCIFDGGTVHIVCRSMQRGDLVYYTKIAKEDDRYLVAGVKLGTLKGIVDEGLYDRVGQLILSNG
ncbi:MAG TPA: hypothetical protein VG796_11495 [Verrucomicrobiales bacterium]|nr:hypothetical protein [Verrucomicrobiales bacterium]